MFGNKYYMCKKQYNTRIISYSKSMRKENNNFVKEPLKVEVKPLYHVTE